MSCVGWWCLWDNAQVMPVLEQGEDELQVCVTEGGVQAHQLAQRQQCRRAQCCADIAQAPAQAAGTPQCVIATATLPMSCKHCHGPQHLRGTSCRGSTSLLLPPALPGRPFCMSQASGFGHWDCAQLGCDRYRQCREALHSLLVVGCIASHSALMANEAH